MTNRYPTHTDFLPEPTAPLDLQVRYHTARGRKLQSQAMGAYLAKLWHGLPNALPTMANWLKRWNQRARTREALMACSDRTLADVGIAREHIALVAKGVDHRDPAALVPRGWRPGLATALPTMVGWLERWNQRARTREALEACSDRTLADVGIAREHIALVAKGVDHRDPIALGEHGWRPRLAAVLYQLGFARPEQRRVLRELSAYSDADLNDLGIRRSDIAQIARAA